MNENYWDLFAKKLSGEMSDEEEREFSKWLHKHPEQITLFERVKSNWTKITPSPTNNNVFDSEQEWHKLKTKIDSQKHKGSIWHLKQQRWPLVAASVMLLALFSIMLFKENKKIINTNENIMATNDSLRRQIEFIPVDSSRIIYLPDSSKVFLNKNSLLTYSFPYNINERHLTLEGEAYFEVRPSKIPFIVDCNSTSTKVLGTSFNIKGDAKKQTVELKVTSGRVEFSESGNKDKKTIVSKNEKCIFNKKHKSFKKSPHYSNENEWWLKTNIKSKIKKFLKKIA